MAFNYGGRAEIVDAVRELVADGVKPEKVTEKAIRSHLYFPDQPDPDLVIRTSGEHRISNFLLWQLAYSELVFTEVLWPDFRRTAPVRRGARLPAPPAPVRGRHLMGSAGRLRDDTGSRPCAIKTRVGSHRLGARRLVYVGVVVAWHAGFTAAAPFVVIPARAPRHDRRRQPAERASDPVARPRSSTGPTRCPCPSLRAGGAVHRRRDPAAAPTRRAREADPTAPRPGSPAPGHDPVP